MKILIITYYWPPAGGPGVQRWLKFVKYLRDFGVDPIVYIPENPTYPIEDQTLWADVPEDITILKKSIFEPYRFAQVFSKKETSTISKGIISGKEKQSFVQKLLLFVRGNFFIPDARKYWVKPSIEYLTKYIKENRVDTIITTGPPHSVHLIGKGLKEQTGAKWFADFRDPWTTIGYHDKLKLTKQSIAKHKLLEREVLSGSDHIIVTSYTTKNEFEGITNKPISVITNGYDTEPIDEMTLDVKFTVSHIGSLLLGRDPKELWRAIFELTKENEAFSKAFQLQLVGAVSDDVLISIKEAGLSNFLSLNGYVSHSEAVRVQRCSQVLLLIEIDSKETKCIIPGKLFEYMASKRPIIAVGPKGADVSKIISETNSGSFFEYSDCEKMKAQLLKLFIDFQKGKLQSQVVNLEKYSRRSLTKKLADLLKKS